MRRVAAVVGLAIATIYAAAFFLIRSSHAHDPGAGRPIYTYFVDWQRGDWILWKMFWPAMWLDSCVSGRPAAYRISDLRSLVIDVRGTAG